MAHIGSAADFEITSNQQNQSYAFPLAAMTTLFFLWGFITVLNDVLIPHLRNVFSLSFAQAMSCRSSKNHSTSAFSALLVGA